MAYNNLNNPANTAGQDFYGATAGAITKAHVFADLQYPDIADFITYNFPQFGVTHLLGRIGRKNSVGNDSWQYFEKAKLRKAYTIGAGSSNLTGAATATIKLIGTTVAATSLLVNDVLRFENGEFGRITAATQSTNDVDLTVVKLSSGNFNLAAGDRFAHLYNLQPERSGSPGGRVWKEETFTEKMAIMRRNITCSTTEAGNIKWVKHNGKDRYYFINEMETMEQMAFDREMYILTGLQTASNISTTTPQGGNGIIPRVLSRGVVGTFSSSVSETDLLEQIRLMCVNSPATEFTVLCGSKFMKDATYALRQYQLAGAVDYGAFAGLTTVGLKLQSYVFMDKLIHFKLYYPFADQSVFPDPARTGINWDNAALFLNMGSDRHGSLLEMKYKTDLFGNSLEFVRKEINGITAASPSAPVQASNAIDGFDVELYSSIGLQLRMPNSFGILHSA
jgi:hypothetical protein